MARVPGKKEAAMQKMKALVKAKAEPGWHDAVQRLHGLLRENHGERRSAQVLHRFPDVLRSNRSARHAHSDGARRDPKVPKRERILNKRRLQRRAAARVETLARIIHEPTTLNYI